MVNPIAGGVEEPRLSATTGTTGNDTQKQRGPKALGNTDGEFIIHMVQQGLGIELV